MTQNPLCYPIVRVGIGQDSHRFLSLESTKPCIIGGLMFTDAPGLSADSDGDVVFHAICNAITSVTGVPILGGIAIDLCHKDGITDSQVYLEKAMETLGSQRVQHVALTIEGKRPRFQVRVQEMREKIAAVMKISLAQVGLTVTSGDGLTDFGCGDGLQCFCILTTAEVKL
ncbi:MAG: 2-C-methyl-D-erythritol 2,4-cyclodiphosphate synthase [Rhabdochlamydiaceae bacterium]|nr:2-C-methyl-D-erythritol 2,4-cyclodiphosphate synthase [Rhabdochlamydiaceae bacterium]